MKKIIALLCVLLIAAGCVWWFVMDPVALDRADVAVIEVREIGGKLSEDNITYEDLVFQITEENHIHYITDFLNNILPFPGTLESARTPTILTFLDHQGNEITSVTIHGNDYLVTNKGTW